MKEQNIQLTDLSGIVEDLTKLECPNHHIKAVAFSENSRIVAYGCCKTFIDHLAYISNSAIETMIADRLKHAVESMEEKTID